MTADNQLLVHLQYVHTQPYCASGIYLSIRCMYKGTLVTHAIQKAPCHHVYPVQAAPACKMKLSRDQEEKE